MPNHKTSHDPIPLFSHLLHMSSLAFLPYAPFVRGTCAMNCAGIAFLYSPSNSSSGLNPNDLLSAFFARSEVKYVGINILAAP